MPPALAADVADIEAPMPREGALIDAALTVQRWQRQFPRWMHYRATHYIAHRMQCYPTWDAIEAEIVRRSLAEDVPARRAA